MTSCLRAEGLCKKFGSLHAVKDVCFTVSSGECRAIIGPNGAGKTTLFNLLNGQLPPSAGTLYLFEQDVTGMPPHQRLHLGLARTFQVTNLMFNLTVLDNVKLAVKATKPFKFAMHRSQNSYTSLFAESQQLLSDWDLWDKRSYLVRDLSYGEQRRTELAMALASKPRVLLLDEPTSGLSGAEAVSFVNLIREVKQSTTMIIVEHHMDVVFDLADSITVLHYGQVIAEGSKEEIKAHALVREVYLGVQE